MHHPPEMMESGNSNHLKISSEIWLDEILGFRKIFPLHTGGRTELLVDFAFHVRCCYLRRKLWA